MTMVYLDYAGTALPNPDALSETFHMLQNKMFINPHTNSTIGDSTHELIKQTRERILNMYNTNSSKYTCVFTHGATSSIKTIGESFKWGNFVYTKSNHNSIIGIRHYTVAQGGGIMACTDEFETIFEQDFKPTENTLVAFPAECNFSGKLFNLDQIEEQRKRWPNTYILLDAAKYCATNLLDLEKYTPDFVPISLYKLIGYPTGLGVLLIKNTSFNVLSKKYFGGGTYDVNIAEKLFSVPREDFVQKYEDGTVPFISIIEAGIGLKYFLEDFSIKRNKLKEITQYALSKLSSIKHYNNVNLLRLYGVKSADTHGSILAFNLQDSKSQYIGYKHFEKMCGVAKIQVRTGCFCNPGACAEYLGLTTDHLLKQYLAGNKCWFKEDSFDGKPTGAIRISFGFQTTKKDIDTLYDFLQSNFIEHVPEYTPKDIDNPRLTEIIVFPIKSCLGFKPTEWPMTPTGLKWDRVYTIYDKQGKVINSQRNLKLSYIQPKLDLETQMIYITDLQTDDTIGIKIGTSPDYVNTWLSSIIDQECTLVYSPVAKTNRGQVLLINENSVLDLNWRVLSKNKMYQWISWIPSILGVKDIVKDLYYSQNARITCDRFRGNLVISGVKSYIEDAMTSLTIESETGEVCIKTSDPCVICYTTTINQQSHNRDSELEPMKTLMTYRKTGEAVKFGTLMVSQCLTDTMIKIGARCEIKDM